MDHTLFSKRLCDVYAFTFVYNITHASMIDRCEGARHSHWEVRARRGSKNLLQETFGLLCDTGAMQMYILTSETTKNPMINLYIERERRASMDVNVYMAW